MGEAIFEGTPLLIIADGLRLYSAAPSPAGALTLRAAAGVACERLSWGLAYIDNSGVHAIVNASVRARQEGRRLVVLRGSADVDRVFTLTGTADEVDIGDLGPVELPVQPLQRSLVSSSLLRTG